MYVVENQESTKNKQFVIYKCKCVSSLNLYWCPPVTRRVSTWLLERSGNIVLRDLRTIMSAVCSLHVWCLLWAVSRTRDIFLSTRYGRVVSFIFWVRRNGRSSITILLTYCIIWGLVEIFSYATLDDGDVILLCISTTHKWPIYIKSKDAFVIQCWLALDCNEKHSLTTLGVRDQGHTETVRITHKNILIFFISHNKYTRYIHSTAVQPLL
jgi:hypothetical protein